MTASPRPRLLARRFILFVLAMIAAASMAGLGSATASAEPVLRVEMLKPDHVKPGKFMAMWVTVINVGDEPLSGDLTIKYDFPVGIVPIEPESVGWPTSCTTSGQVVECVIDVSSVPFGRNVIPKTLTEVEPSATGTLTGSIEVSGGGASTPVTVPLSFSTDPIGPFEIKAFDVATTGGPGQAPDQAGAVPKDITTSFEFASEAYSNQDVPFFTALGPSENFRDVTVHVPSGVVGYPTSTLTKCTAAQLSQPNPSGQVPLCPRDSQIGLALVNGKDTVPVYNLVPPRGTPAMFGLFYQGLIVYLRPELRPSDNGIDIVTEMAPSAVSLPKFELTLWGVPTDSSYDRLRAECLFGLDGANGDLCPSLAPREPFLRMPTSCVGPLPWSIDLNTYQRPDTFHHDDASTPAFTGCDLTPFAPQVSLDMSEADAHTTTGLTFKLSVPQDVGPDGIASADVRQVALALPEGVSLNPAAADGLQACGDAQLRLGLAGAPQCPEASKLGTVEVDTPLLEQPLGGSVYLRSQGSQDPASGQMYRLAIALHSEERGVDVKLPGSLVADPATGRLTTTFAGLPQLPFASMRLDLKSGPRAPLTTPATCGTYAAQATLTGWNGKTVDRRPAFTIDRGCDRSAFAPGFEAGVESPAAGRFSPFTLRVTRDPAQPNLSRISATLPEGLLAKLAGVPVCTEVQVSGAGCPASSRIGRVVAGIGDGANPLFLPQPGKAPTAVSLAGPYRGAPYSILTSVPAQSGPFDLGTVLVRSALRIDPKSAQASVESDPLPQIYGGIPVSYRDVRVEIDRPNFTLNPTDCRATEVRGAITSSEGATAQVSDRFQVNDCAALGFRPRLSLRLRGATGRGGNPALRSVFRPRPGDANLERLALRMPRSAFLDQAHIRTICTRVQFAAGAGHGSRCPAGSVYGRARAFTPLLDQPLEGPVYLRSSNNKLPHLVLALSGAGVEIEASARIDSIRGGIRAIFANLPDAPLTKVIVNMQGGKKGLIQNSTHLCHGKNRANAAYAAQNGRQAQGRPVVRAVKCAKKHKKAKRSSHSGTPVARASRAG